MFLTKFSNGVDPLSFIKESSRFVCLLFGFLNLNKKPEQMKMYHPNRVTSVILTHCNEE